MTTVRINPWINPMKSARVAEKPDFERFASSLGFNTKIEGFVSPLKRLIASAKRLQNTISNFLGILEMHTAKERRVSDDKRGDPKSQLFKLQERRERKNCLGEEKNNKEKEKKDKQNKKRESKHAKVQNTSPLQLGYKERSGTTQRTSVLEEIVNKHSKSKRSCALLLRMEKVREKTAPRHQSLPPSPLLPLMRMTIGIDQCCFKENTLGKLAAEKLPTSLKKPIAEPNPITLCPTVFADDIDLLTGSNRDLTNKLVHSASAFGMQGQ
ncbi:hypothetical protein CAPTEDRAFT_207427 [Capitella teleta]|uniref:Uncharacterized protein n=1 Tax=Capitella teleta TaxID=283909 RepID=R7TSX7_CAPTE|nr:hypothetical protein CAPTEDRAFT_207427 [Capitella teleta]|eukprot:ELT94591.1 hypothetical protein CAPTEDRAFT_207427 [Capitella teleta]